MKRNFEKPICETIRFANNDVIATSGCGCNVGGYEFPGCNENYCTSSNTYCDCQTNTTDPTAANCIKP